MVAECKDKQFKNTKSPMLVTESGMVTDCKDEQQKNAPSPMLVTESGMVTDCKDLTLVFASCFISTTCVLNGRKVMTQIL